MKNLRIQTLISLFIVGGLAIGNLGSFDRISSINTLNIEPDYQITQAEKKRILIDISHGHEVFIPAKISPMGAVLEATGKYELIPLFMEEINDSVLQDIDILMIVTPDPNLPYLSSEIEAVKNFWKIGKSLVFIGSYQGAGYESYRPNSELNRLVSNLGFNITFSEDRLIHARGMNSHSLPDHVLTYGLSSIYIADGCPIVIENEPEAIIISDRKDKPNYVAWSNSTHRAIFLGGVNPLFEFLESTASYDPNAFNYTHHYQFQLNLFHWLSKRDPEIIPDFRPIHVYTGKENPISNAELRQLPYFKGACSFHTAVSASEGDPYQVTAADNIEFAEIVQELGYQFVIVADYNTMYGGVLFNQTITNGNYKVNNRLIQVINGQEATGEGGYHTLGWGLTEDIVGVKNPIERIELFHNQSSPCILCHPSWLISPDYPRIWDFTQYPFDGFELVDEGFFQGCGNLVYTGKPWYGGTDAHSADIKELGNTYLYVFTEDISSDPAWWTATVEESRIVIYVAKDDVYVGDQKIVEELLNRFEDTTVPKITVTHKTIFSPNEDVIIDVIITDDSPTAVSISADGSPKGEMVPDLMVLGRFTKNLGTYEDGVTLQISIKATDSLNYENTTYFSVSITEAETKTKTTTITTSKTPGFLWLSLIPIIYSANNKRKKR